MARRIPALLAGLGLVALAAIPVNAKSINSENAFTATNLQSDVPGRALHTDPDLVNGWGITASSSSPWWVSDNGTHRSTLYNGTTGLKVPTVIVDVTGDGGPADPTGVVFNGSASDFKIVVGTTNNAARFIFDSEDGTISGWNAGSASILEVTSTNDAVYKGLAIGSVTGGDTTKQYLYATDFHNNHVDVVDGTWTVQTWPGAFVDPGIPSGFAPFGIQNLGGHLFVTYAKQDADRHDEVDGEGLGFVSEFNTDGSFVGRVASGGDLDAPWGLAMAPAGWERFGGHLLIGNFGDGRINGYRPTASGWEDRGHLKLPNHHPLVIDGLWGIGFGNGTGSGSTNNLYFAAGPDGEMHGLFGSISPS